AAHPIARRIAGLRRRAVDALHGSRRADADTAGRGRRANEAAGSTLVLVVPRRIAKQRLQPLAAPTSGAAIGTDARHASRADLPVAERAGRVASLRNIAVALRRPGGAHTRARAARTEERTGAPGIRPVAGGVASLGLQDVAALRAGSAVHAYA